MKNLLGRLPWAAMCLGIAIALSQFAPVSAEDGTAASSPPTDNFPKAILECGELRVQIYLPDKNKGYYRGTRFEGSGIVRQAEFAGHTYFAEFRTPHHPTGHDDICGTAEEFGMDDPLGYEDAKPGEPFLKIGVGVLERPDGEPYHFFGTYKIVTPGEWKVKAVGDRIEFQQEIQGPRGWAYQYTKVIELSDREPKFTIARTLKNSGEKTIHTTHYGHNFVQIDNLPPGKGYSLSFAFDPKFGEKFQPQGCLELAGGDLNFTANLSEDKAIWGPLTGFQQREDNRVTIRQQSAGAAVEIVTDQPAEKFVLYSSGPAVCPEPFVRINIAPGKEFLWETTYRMISDEKK